VLSYGWSRNGETSLYSNVQDEAMILVGLMQRSMVHVRCCVLLALSQARTFQMAGRIHHLRIGMSCVGPFCVPYLIHSWNDLDGNIPCFSQLTLTSASHAKMYRPTRPILVLTKAGHTSLKRTHSRNFSVTLESSHKRCETFLLVVSHALTLI